VVVATVRALKMHGGIARNALGPENVEAVKRGTANLARHVENLGKFGLPVVVAVNHFTSDTPAEFDAIREAMAALGVEAISCTHWAHGGAGAEALAHAVVARISDGKAAFKPLYPLDLSLAEKIRAIAQGIYRADDIALPDAVARRLKGFEDAGFGQVPVCIAKTQYSFSSDPTVMGAPTGHIIPVREVRLSAGAGFVVAICGDIMTMPGLPRVPAAEAIFLREDGEIEGLF
jgi:formate--tetrahydrofolate ligase